MHGLAGMAWPIRIRRLSSVGRGNAARTFEIAVGLRSQLVGGARFSLEAVCSVYLSCASEWARMAGGYRE
jgi:hypothetical protein